MRWLKTAIFVALFSAACFANELIRIPLAHPTIRRISGRVVAQGDFDSGVEVQVFDHPEVWSDNSLSLVEKRKRQSLVASAVTDKSGGFALRHIHNGSYELCFSKPGFDMVSVTVTVASSASSDQLCVTIPVSEAGGAASVQTSRDCAPNRQRKSREGFCRYVRTGGN